MKTEDKTLKTDYIIGCMRLGSWGAAFNKEQLERFINRCVELDLYAFDHADIYGDYTTEADFGAVIASNSSLRTKIELTTKCGIKKISPNRPKHNIKSYDSSKEHIIASVEQSLTNLNTDYIDHILLHRPDFLMDVDEVAEAYHTLKKDGKIRYFGISNFNKTQLELLKDRIPISTHQLEVSLAHLTPFENGDLDILYNNTIQPTAWSPLGGGALLNAENNESLGSVFNSLNEKYNCNTAQLLYAWLRMHPSGIIPVLGSSKIERIEEAKKAVHISLSREDWYKLYSASKGEKLP